MASVLPPRSMQQTTILIIMLSAYVSGIRNGGGGSAGSSNHHNYASTSFPHASDDDFFSSQSLQDITTNTQNSGAFRPSQMLEFTTADATAPHQYPPTYEDNNYSTIPIPTQIQSTAEVRYDMEKQFTFPTNDDEEPQQQQQAAATNYNNRYASNINNNKYNYNYHSNAQSAVTVPTQLQSTPILTYHDSYTNENYHYTPSPIETNNHYQQQHHQQQHHQLQHHQQQRPQEYTVQSSLLVGTDKYGGYQQQQQTNQQRPTYQQYQRPGYVIDEQQSPSYERPIYTEQPHKYAQYQSLSSHQQHPNALPNYNRELPEQRPKPVKSQPPRPELHLSYDSHDYPPPSYFQQLQQQQQQQQQQSMRPFQSPQRQDTRPPAYATTSPNYANNFGNYLQGGGEQYPGNYKRPIPSQSSPAQTPPYNFVNDQQYSPRPPQQRPPPSSYNPYSDYQQGELPPPSSSYNPNYRPPPPPYRPQPQQQQQPASSGLASLASLFGNTQQYAPQFTSLLLGGGGGSSTSAGNPLGSLLGALTGAGSNSGVGGGGGGYGGSPSRPLNMQVIKALENIARNDDLECVPKVLCQMIAGQTQRGQLPSVITSPAITNFLAGFPAASPALIYGRAALLGISGGDRSCAQTYAKCPKNEYEILHYLNNHRGGFFKFFSEPEEQTTTQQSAVNGGGGGGGGASTSLFSILSALAGNSPPPATTPRPTRRPTAAPSADITSGIGNFFSNVLSEYLGGGVEYQRRRRRRRSLVFNDEQEEIDAALEQEAETAARTESDEDFHDEEDEEDTQNGLDMETSNEQPADVEGRILHHKDVSALDGPKFFPEIEESPRAEDLKNVIKVFNKVNAQRKLKFPSETELRDYKDARELEMMQQDEDEDYRGGKQVHFRDDEDDHRGGKQVHFRDEQEYGKLPNYGVNINHYDFESVKANRNGKKVVFKDTDEEPENDQAPQYSGVVSIRHEQTQMPTSGARVIFPDRYEALIRKGRILNRPEYAENYSDYVRSYDDDRDKFVVSDSKRRPHYQGSSGGGGSSLSINNNYNNNAYLSQSSSSTSNTNNYVNYGGANHNADSNSNRYHRPTTKYPNYVSSANNSYDYPNNNYVSSNRYGSSYASTRTTRRPYAQKQQEDDKNVYVTNGRGMTEYYITPDGRKVYLR